MLHTKSRLFVLRRRAMENAAVVHLGLIPFLVRGIARALLGQHHGALLDFAQVHRTSRIEFIRRVVEPYILRHRDVAYAPPGGAGRWDIRRSFGQRVMVLKEPRSNEKGVLYVMFTEMLLLMFQQLDLRKLMKEYRLVIEPSWTGYCDEDFLRYMQFDDVVFVAAAFPGDFGFLQRAKSNLIPIPIGPCDWVDPDTAAPYLGNAKEFDIVMNANWGSWKRHHVLFRMLKNAKRRYSAVLIGGGLDGRTTQDIYDLADLYGVRSQITIYESVPYTRVMDITCRARVSVLLSLKEGSNRSISEAIFCNVPVIVLSNHVGGIIKNVVPETGLLVKEDRLEEGVEQLVTGSLSPRAWGLANVSCFKTSVVLNDALLRHALAKGEPWTADIAGRANSPESKYLSSDDEKRLQPWNQKLVEFVIDSDGESTTLH